MSTAFLLTGCAPDDGGGLSRFAYEEPHMGTAVRVVVWAPTRAEADGAAAAAFATASRLDSLFSDYRDDSGVAELARAAGQGEARPVAPELWAVLEASRVWAERTGGAFDVTLGPLTRLWRAAMRAGDLPDSVAWDAARAASGIEGLALDPETRTARLLRPGMSLDLGGIAKGYVADAMLDTLAARGFDTALVDAGGDLALGAAPPGEAGWAVEFPGGEVHRLSGVGVATSGDRYQFLEVDGVRYSHILDPRTGAAVRQAPIVAVIAPDATTADVLASALSVLEPERGRALVEELDGVAARVTWAEGGGDAAPAPLPADATPPASWQTDGFPATGPPARPPSD